MIFNVYDLLLLILQFKQVHNLCEFSSSRPILMLQNDQYSYNQTLPNEFVQGQINQGFGVWMNYQPFTYKELRWDKVLPNNTQYQQNHIKGGQFIYSIEENVEKSNWIVVSAEIDSIQQKITHKVFYSFKTSKNTLSFQFDNFLYEGQWIMFFCYFDNLLRQAQIGFYNSKEALSIQVVNDLPEYKQQIKHIVGNFYFYKNQDENLIMLNIFQGLLTSDFSAKQDNVFLDLESCSQYFFSKIYCYDSSEMLIEQNQEFNGNEYQNFISSRLQVPRYVFKGWIILKQSNQDFLESTVFRITVNSKYYNDFQVGDRDLLLQYYQSNIPAQNGFKLTTYSYQFPIYQRYKTKEDDEIKQFGDEYSELLIQWHYFQYEIGTLNNDGQPIFSIFFPSIDQIRQFNWNKKIYHFSGTLFITYFGGDDFTQNYFRGNVSNLQFKRLCKPEIEIFMPTCHYSCLTCDGPTINNCLTCYEQSFRSFSKKEKICACKQSYVDLNGVQECQEVTKVFPQIQIQEIELNCQHPGYSICNQDNIECLFGYFKYNNKCVQCPNYFDTFSGIQINCLDCLERPNLFGKTLTCKIRAETCEQNPEYIYKITQRSENENIVYNILTGLNESYELKLCHGCASQDTCHKSFYRDDQQCKPCIEGCEICENSFKCTSCFETYYLNEDKQCVQCKDCYTCYTSDQGEYVCYTCQTNLIRLNNKCVTCGHNCQSCYEERLCNYCKGSPSEYYLSFDGINCNQCNIKNCIYCFDYILNDGLFQTSLDLNFKRIDQKTQKVNVGCALCKENYYYNFNNQECELKQIDDDCLFGIIQDIDQKKVCLISNTDQNAVQVSDCSIISNCISCIHNYLENESFCMLCEDGYYSSILTGQCIQCGKKCKTCIQQQEQFRDYWKWNIKAFYKFVINHNNDHPFEKYASSDNEDDLNLVCTSCHYGYILSGQKCFKGCDSTCNKCEIINEQATCIQCLETVSGFTKSYELDGSCRKCPSNCKACSDRTYEEIEELNPQFFLTENNYYKTRICYEKSTNQFGQEKYYQDSLTQTVVVCTKYDQCVNKIIIQINAYCDSYDYYTQKQQSNDEFFDHKNILLSQYGFYEYLSELQTVQLFDYLNYISVKYVQFEYTIIQGEYSNCRIRGDQTFDTRLAQNIFSIQQMDIQFKGKILESSSPITLQTPLQLFLSNYTNITFENINFDFGFDDYSPDNYLIIAIDNKKKTNLNLIDCNFIKTSSFNTHQFLRINSSNPYSLYIKNLQISNLNVQSSEIFTFFSTKTPLQNQIQISNMTIKNSIFTNSTLFYFQADTGHLRYESNLINISIDDSKFISSKFFSSSSQLNFTIGTLNIQKFSLNNVKILNHSSIFLVSIFEQATISQLIFTNSQLKDNSYFYSSNIINLKDCLFNHILLESSCLINNKVEYSKNQEALNQSQKVFIIDCQFLNINQNDKQQIIIIVKYDEIDQLIIQLTNFIMSDCTSNTKLQNTQVSFDQVMIYIECQLCYLQEIQIQRSYGIPEITILNSKNLEIRNFQISQNQKHFPQVFHSNIDCVSQFANMELYFFLYVGQYESIVFDNLTVSNCLSFNSPLIILQGYELMQKLVEETVYIKDSQLNSNLLIISETNKQTALIFIESKQKGLITFMNTIFSQNHLNQYYESLSLVSSTTLLLSCKYEIVIMQSCQFYQNIITNSTDSILQIDSEKLYIKNSNFKNNNIMNYSILSKQIILSSTQDITSINFQLIFPIKSNSGNGMLIANTILIENVKVDSSNSIFGGGFYIVVFGQSVINITNSQFSNTKSTLSSLYFSKGGCFYIDASSSTLTLKIKNVTFDGSYSRYDGGAIYLSPSETYNSIEFNYLIVKNCFSIQNQFLSYTLSNKDNIKSQITFSNIDFYSTQEGLENFYSQLDSITDDDILNIINSNPLVFVQFGNFSMQNCSFQSIYMQMLLKIVQVEHIQLSNIIIINCTVALSSLIQLNLRQQYVGILEIFNLQITQIQQIQKTEIRECLAINRTSFIQLDCPLEILPQNFQIIQKDLIQENLNQLICNQIKIFRDPKFTFSLIEIEQINSRHYLRIEKLNFKNVLCKKCQNGLIRIVEIEKQNEDNIKLSQIMIQNSNCGRAGCLSISKNKNDLTNLKSDINYRILQQHNYENLLNSLKYQVIIKQSLFQNNTSLYGGSLLIIKINTIIKGCIFLKNIADIGGAIYFSSEDEELYIFDSKINENTAKIAGGLYLNSQQLQLTKQLDLELNSNNSTLFGSNVVEKPRSLTLSIDEGRTLLEKKELKYNDNEIVEQIIIIPYNILGFNSKMNQLMLPSGIQISSYRHFDNAQFLFIQYNLTLRIIALDKFQKQIMGLSGSYCTLQPKAINLSSQREEFNFEYSLSQYDVQFNETTGDYNLDDLIIFFNPTYDKDIILRLQIQCNSVSVPQYQENPPYKIYNYITNYKLLVDIRTFPCQLGEFLNKTSGGCVLCDTFKNQYQVSRNAQNCSYKDDTKIKSLESSMIELREHNWRAYYYSETIEYCYHLLENCKGGWMPGDESCILGHIGALCEQCDLYDSRGGGSYSVSSVYSCGSCDDIAYNIISIILLSLWTIITTLITVSSTTQMIKEFVKGLRLKAFGVRVAIKEAQAAIFIKVFTNYLQIISTITTFQLQIPIGFSSVFNSVGNPVNTLAYSLDCFLINITDILIIYFRIIWSLIMTSTYISIIFSLFGIAIIIKITKFNFSFITTSLIYLFIFFQPNLIGGIISLFSYRKISDEYWIQGNVAYRYDTNQHTQWLITFCLPLLLIFGTILPFFLWHGVYKNRDRLDFSQVRKTWGYLYNEYGKHAYFWETIKIIQKEIIIIVLTYYDDHISIKASLVFLVLFSYSLITIKQRPYMTGQLNQIDTESTVVCAISIILASSIFTAQQQKFYEIVWPFYFIIFFLNSFYILKMVIQIIFAYLKKHYEKVDVLKELIVQQFPKFVNSKPFIQKLFETHKNQQSRIKQQYKKLRLYLLPQARLILEFKKLKRLELSSKKNVQKCNDKDRHDTEQQFSQDNFCVKSFLNKKILNHTHIKRDEFQYRNTKIGYHQFLILSRGDDFQKNQKTTE
ncbi:unnamed protein product [Paramecium pentaurelia]|uniref:Uncharacterized protein n=1 Tax=Paramecium pentaurelia TaxID=43138 RepID=A0A8S1UYP2_9CILI|nr:unnamed protein product [Paramecium pentaurelia]